MTGMSFRQATIRAVAKAAGVSPTTAFRALTDGQSVKASTREKVLAARRLLENEPPQSDAQSGGSSLSVGIIMPASTARDIGRHPSMFVIVTSFLSELSGSGIANTMLVFDENTMTGEDLLLKPMDGYLITGTSEEQENMIVPVLSRAGIPCVLVNRRSEAPHVGSVNIDDMNACSDAADYLIGLGHRRIAFLGGRKNYQNTKRRLQGFQQAMQRAGLPVPDEWILFGDYSALSGYSMGKSVAEREDRPTAILCASDTIAIGCMHALEEKGLDVPGDISVVGFGDIESSRVSTPPLTTVAQPSVEVGVAAAKVLMQMISMPVMLSQQAMLQTRMIIRGSTAAVTAQKG